MSTFSTPNLAQGIEDMKLRKNIRSLTPIEKDNFVDACLQLKQSGQYDEYVHLHHQVMKPTVLPHEPNDPNYRNGAHRGLRSCPGIGHFC
ncbi:hypothetical protein LJJ44_21795 [Pseudomonas sp. B24_DOA]|nr:hypothetical protein LJJ44_21795 [Pseudomonas sp. B24_DOA]